MPAVNSKRNAKHSWHSWVVSGCVGNFGALGQSTAVCIQGNPLWGGGGVSSSSVLIQFENTALRNEILFATVMCGAS